MITSMKIMVTAVVFIPEMSLLMGFIAIKHKKQNSDLQSLPLFMII